MSLANAGNPQVFHRSLSPPEKHAHQETRRQTPGHGPSPAGRTRAPRPLAEVYPGGLGNAPVRVRRHDRHGLVQTRKALDQLVGQIKVFVVGQGGSVVSALHGSA